MAGTLALEYVSASPEADTAARPRVRQDGRGGVRTRAEGRAFAMGRLRAVAMAGVLLLVVTGCGALGRGGHKGPSASAPKPAEVLDAMREDVTAAVRAALPGGVLSAPGYGGFNCKSSKWKDTPGAGEVVKSESYSATGRQQDKDERSADELVGAMVQALTARGWAVRAGKFAAGDSAKEMAKPGVAGSVQLSASRFTVTSGRTVPVVNAAAYSDCLPDPDAAEK
jgi:hypothetical protein